MKRLDRSEWRSVALDSLISLLLAREEERVNRRDAAIALLAGGTGVAEALGDGEDLVSNGVLERATDPGDVRATKLSKPMLGLANELMKAGITMRHLTTATTGLNILHALAGGPLSRDDLIGALASWPDSADITRPLNLMRRAELIANAPDGKYSLTAAGTQLDVSLDKAAAGLQAAARRRTVPLGPLDPPAGAAYRARPRRLSRPTTLAGRPAYVLALLESSWPLVLRLVEEPATVFDMSEEDALGMSYQVIGDLCRELDLVGVTEREKVVDASGGRTGRTLKRISLRPLGAGLVASLEALLASCQTALPANHSPARLLHDLVVPPPYEKKPLTEAPPRHRWKEAGVRTAILRGRTEDGASLTPSTYAHELGIARLTLNHTLHALLEQNLAFDAGYGVTAPPEINAVMERIHSAGLWSDTARRIIGDTPFMSALTAVWNGTGHASLASMAAKFGYGRMLDATSVGLILRAEDMRPGSETAIRHRTRAQDVSSDEEIRLTPLCSELLGLAQVAAKARREQIGQRLPQLITRFLGYGGFLHLDLAAPVAEAWPAPGPSDAGTVIETALDLGLVVDAGDGTVRASDRDALVEVAQAARAVVVHWGQQPRGEQAQNSLWARRPASAHIIPASPVPRM